MTAAHDGLILSNILSYTVRKKARGALWIRACGARRTYVVDSQKKPLNDAVIFNNVQTDGQAY